MMGCCRELTRKIASDEFREATLWQRFAVRFHLLRCCHCQRYARQLREIGSAARTLWIPPLKIAPQLSGSSRAKLTPPYSSNLKTVCSKAIPES